MSDRIITAKDICERDRVKTYRQWLLKTCANMRGLATPFNGRVTGLAVQAVVEAGRWVAHCITPGCNGCEYVRPDEALFYCCSCGNRANGGAARPVTFPGERERLEAALLKRPVVLGVGLSELDRIRTAQPRIEGLLRWWAPPVTVEQLEAENESAGIGEGQPHPQPLPTGRAPVERGESEIES